MLSPIKRATIRVPKRKWIIYTAANNESSSRVASSYVCTDVSNDKPQFGPIINLYSHTFGGCISVISRIKLYQAATCDTELNMWHVPQEATNRITYYLLEKISVPLIVGYDSKSSSIWFLNYNTTHDN